MITTQAQVDLCNQAFRSLGEKPITLPVDVSNPRWLLAQEFFDQVQDGLFSEHFWNFAAKRASLSPVVGVTPAHTFSYAFALPADYISIQRAQMFTEYQREGIYFVSNDSPLSLIYTARITDVTLWPVYFKGAFIAALTAAFAEQITGQLQKAQTWLQIADRRLARAKVKDSQEGTPPVLDSGILVRARFGGRG